MLVCTAAGLQTGSAGRWSSVNGQKAWVALLELGVPYEERRIDRYDKSQDFVEVRCARGTRP